MGWAGAVGIASGLDAGGRQPSWHEGGRSRCITYRWLGEGERRHMLPSGELRQVLGLLGSVAIEKDTLEPDALVRHEHGGQGCVDAHLFAHAGVPRVREAEPAVLFGDLQPELETERGG